MKSLLAIDPGANGGIAWINSDGIVCAAPMPDGMTSQADFIRRIRTELPQISCLMEKTGTYMPGNSGPAAATFARHVGHLEALLYCFGIPVVQVSPQKWMASFGKVPKDKKERKQWLKEGAARRCPHLTVTLKTSDALMLLAYGLKNLP